MILFLFDHIKKLFWLFNLFSLQSSRTKEWLALHDSLDLDDGAAPPPNMIDLKAAIVELKEEIKKKKVREFIFSLFVTTIH